MGRRAIPLVLVLVAAGCGGGGDEGGGNPERAVEHVPRPFKMKIYADANVEIRYPAWWSRSSTRPELVLSDDTADFGAYVSLRYLPRRSWTTREGFARLAGRLLRPPAGKGLTRLYTETAVIGGRRGLEAAFVWQYRQSTPLGPRMRTFGIELPSGRVAFFVFAAENPTLHAKHFAWVKKLIVWRGAGIGAGSSLTLGE